tara:strand:+ start:700 stop:1158 length:459 start_codon:yes stop_codon:yes gene_type:complete
MTSLENIVQTFRDTADAHLYVNSFAFGSIDYLDSSSQNIKYPYVFLRPLQSPGYSQTTRLRVLSFELYALDVPKLSNESPEAVMSKMEQVLYDFGGYMNWGPPSDNQSDGVSYDIQSITPTLEAFMDRTYGFVATIQYTESGIYDFCNFPKI